MLYYCNSVYKSLFLADKLIRKQILQCFVL